MTGPTAANHFPARCLVCRVKMQKKLTFLGFAALRGVMNFLILKSEKYLLTSFLLLFALLLPLPGLSGPPPQGGPNFTPCRVGGQVVYVPVYSHIFIGDRETPFLLTVTILVRNTDPQHSLQVWSADYHDSSGKLLKQYLPNPVRLPPLATAHFIVPESDESGGAGANVVVTWKSPVPINPPIIESVMIGTRSQQGISFTSRGQVLDISNSTATGSQPMTTDEVNPRQP